MYPNFQSILLSLSLTLPFKCIVFIFTFSLLWHHNTIAVSERKLQCSLYNLQYASSYIAYKLYKKIKCTHFMMETTFKHEKLFRSFDRFHYSGVFHYWESVMIYIQHSIYFPDKTRYIIFVA